MLRPAGEEDIRPWIELEQLGDDVVSKGFWPMQVSRDVEVLEAWCVVETVRAVEVAASDVDGLLEPLWQDVLNEGRIL